MTKTNPPVAEGLEPDDELSKRCRAITMKAAHSTAAKIVDLCAGLSQKGRVEIGSDDPLYKVFRPSRAALAAIEENEAANAAGLAAIRSMMLGHVENWPDPKLFSTAISLIDKTIHAARTSEAARIEALEAHLAEARRVLAPFAREADDWTPDHQWLNDDHPFGEASDITIADLRAARSLLSQGEGG